GGVGRPEPEPEPRTATTILDVMAETPAKTKLEEQRRALPDAPGVYMFVDERGRVLYAGKAKSIRKRVASHFSGRSARSATAATELLSRIDRIDVVETQNEAEALLAEQRFIKQHRPLF